MRTSCIVCDAWPELKFPACPQHDTRRSEAISPVVDAALPIWNPRPKAKDRSPKPEGRRPKTEHQPEQSHQGASETNPTRRIGSASASNPTRRSGFIICPVDAAFLPPADGQNTKMLKDFGFQQKILESGWRKTHKIGSRTKTTQRPDKDNSTRTKDQRTKDQTNKCFY